ncbi:glycosyltransferase family 4 protein [Paenibacillus rigui]|uniref:Glycosyl transferase family 1 n=1 Tax=Paenibacillus rigui TaxID=554312 RepID=A0A229UVK2_9BACL|nr:glycosyltransferase family 4 protein [Paenibacillus rigui]OXM87343.1 glycosyl transferase family 1 [Paenibacillus rigui]
MSRPVVVIISPGSFAIPSATSSSVELVVEQVAKRLTREVQPVVIGKTVKGSAASEVIDGVSYVRVPASSPQAYIRKAARKLNELRPALIQVENRPRFARHLRRVHPNAAIWLVLHSLTFVSRPHIGDAELRRCLAAADRIVVNSNFLKEQLIRKAPAVRGKIAVNHLGVDMEAFISRWSEEGRALRERKLSELGYSGKKVILYVGRLIEIKGVHHLLQAMPQIAAQVQDVVLLVVGSAYYGSGRVTPYVQKLYRIARQMPRHIRFVSYVPHSEIAAWFRLADVLVVPSNKKEAFGLVNVEAMASGVPVVATRAGGMKEIIDHGVTGYLVDASVLNKELTPWIVTLLQQERLVRQLGEESIRKVREQFTWERTAERWLALYRSVPKMKK